MAVFKDLTGKKFNRLTVLGLGKRNSSGQIQWKCKCNCGNIVFATTTYLKTGHTKSYGCLNKENASLVFLKKYIGELTPFKSGCNEDYFYLSYQTIKKILKI